MRCVQWATSWALLSLLSAVPVWADETQVLIQGILAPFSGVLVPEEAVKRLVRDLTRYRTQEAEIETLKAALAAAERENSNLRQANALADQMVARFEKAMDAYDRALSKSNALMERQEKRIEQLESREKWMMILGPLGLLIGLVAGAAL